MVGAETFGRGRETRWRLLERLSNDEDPANSITHFEGRNLLPNDWISGVGAGECHFVQRPIRNQAVNSPAFVFQLAHRLFECATRLTNQIVFGNSNIGIEHFAEVSIHGQIFDGTNIYSWSIHRHDNFAYSRMR